MLRLYAGMDRLLHALRADGYRLGLVTSKSRPTTDMAFRTTGIEPLFDAVVCAEDTARNKPYPDPLLRAAELLEVAPGGCRVRGRQPVRPAGGPGRGHGGASPSAGACSIGRRSRPSAPIGSCATWASSRRCWACASEVRARARERLRRSAVRAAVQRVRPCSAARSTSSRASRSCVRRSATTTTATTCSTAPRSTTTEYDELFRELRRLEEAHPESRHPRLAHPARGRRAALGLRPGAASGAHALAGEREGRRRTGRVARAGAQAVGRSRLRSGRAALRARAQDRRAGRLAAVRRRPAGDGRHPGQRRGGRGRHPEPAHRGHHPAGDAARRDAHPRPRRGARRGLPAAGRLRPAERAARRRRGVDLRQPAQLGRRLAAPARPAGDGVPAALDVVLRCGRRRGAASGRRTATSGPIAASLSPRTGRCWSGCATTASRSTPTRAGWRRWTRSSPAATSGTSGGPSWTSTSTAWWSRSTTAPCRPRWGRWAATRAGPWPSSSRRRRRRPGCGTSASTSAVRARSTPSPCSTPSWWAA